RSHPRFGGASVAPQYAPKLGSDERPLLAPQKGLSVSVADELRKLSELRSEGILTDEEFATQKARLLST
ncbi:MAG TPA: SHOCT domain-containing protein, partial [Solirubrobacteraceae bacterium]